MVVLGIDPGYAIVGYGAINYENNSFTPISFGSIITKADTDFNRRHFSNFLNFFPILLGQK